MKNSKKLLLGISASLVLFSAVPGRAAATSAEQWLTHYYQNPQPEQFVPAIFDLSHAGFFEQPGHVSLAIGFIAGVMTQNPDQIDQWLLFSRALPPAHQRLMVSALWYSGHPKGAAYLRAHARGVSPQLRAEIEQLLASGPALRDAPVLSASSLNLQWGAFLATGESQHVMNVLAALGSSDPGLSSAVRLALAEKAATHEKVQAICAEQLARQPEGVRDQLRAAMNDAKFRP